MYKLIGGPGKSMALMPFLQLGTLPRLFRSRESRRIGCTNNTLHHHYITIVQVHIPTFKLNNGLEIPAIGAGTYLDITGKIEYNFTDWPGMQDALSYAIDIGYRHIDTAHLYRVEPEIGELVNKKIADKVIRREDVFITSKVWQHNHRIEDVDVSVRASLKRMKLDYLDLILMHWPMSISQEGVDEHIDYLETWRGFELVLEKGLVKSIGVSNFNEAQMKRLVANCKVVPAVLQVEVNLNFGQKELVNYCRTQNIVVIAHSPFGTMMPIRNYPNSPEPKLNNPIMLGIAKKYKKTVPQIALRYLHQRGIIPIPKLITKDHVRENAAIFDFELSKLDIATIAEFDNGYRTVHSNCFQEYDNYPYEKVEMDEVCEIPLVIMKWKNGINGDID